MSETGAGNMAKTKLKHAIPSGEKNIRRSI
jgi:hypothetical protein